MHVFRLHDATTGVIRLSFRTQTNLSSHVVGQFSNGNSGISVRGISRCINIGRLW